MQFETCCVKFLFLLSGRDVEQSVKEVKLERNSLRQVERKEDKRRLGIDRKVRNGKCMTVIVY